jgi:hypothetical protein
VLAALGYGLRLMMQDAGSGTGQPDGKGIRVEEKYGVTTETPG